MKTYITSASSFLKSLFLEIGGHGTAKKLVCILSLLLLGATAINLSLEIRSTSAPKAIVYSTDNDAGRAIQTAQLTRWYKSNHFAPYGNLYFRFAHTIAQLSPEHNDANWTAEENEDIRHHFALALTSLFALTGLCIFLAYLLLGDFTWSLLLGNVFLHIGLYDQTWMYFVFRAHPDHLLMLMVGIACYFTLRYTSTKSHKDFVLAGLLWGVATATKTATTLFIPSFLYLFLSEGMNKESVKKGFRFVGYMLLAYLIVGFPQNFGFYKHIKFLISESQNGRAANMASIIEYSTLIWDQTKYFILAFIPIHFLFGSQQKIMNRKFVIFAAIALVVLFARRMVVPQTHHPMPFVAMILVTVIFSLKLLPVVKFKYKGLALFAVGLASLYFMRNFPTAVADQMAHQLHCRPEAVAMLNRIKEVQQDGESKLGREPYFPFDSSNKLSKQFWGASMQDLDTHDISIFGSKRSFGEQFILEGPQYNMNEKALNWSDKQDLYQKVLNDDIFTTPEGRTFEKVLEDKCGFMLWEKVE